jgi:DUF4097 and DUF4098 domain-containing protein YvlB
MGRKLLIFLAFSCLVVQWGFSDTQVKTIDVSGKVFLKVRTIAGNISFIGSAASDQVKITSEISGKGISPKFEISDRQIVISEKRDNPEYFSENIGSIDFEIELPVGSSIEGKTISGEILVKKVAGNVDVKSVSGDIQVFENGKNDVEASSVSGEVYSEFSSVFSSVMTLGSISGDVVVSFPKGADARIGISTLSGKIKCALDLTDKEEKKGFGSLSVRGISGKGDGKIKLSSISGNIKIY